jgi:hypothetical protein
MFAIEIAKSNEWKHTLMRKVLLSFCAPDLLSEVYFLKAVMHYILYSLRVND